LVLAVDEEFGERSSQSASIVQLFETEKLCDDNALRLVVSGPVSRFRNFKISNLFAINSDSNDDDWKDDELCKEEDV